MALATWWRNDERPALSPPHGFFSTPSRDDAELARINRILLTEVEGRRAQGHRPYVAYIWSEPVAYGWVATREATIGELPLHFKLPSGNYYLWDFRTLPHWQGYGLYAHLLRSILSAEEGNAERFWIIYAPENLPSGAGVLKAGFRLVGELSFTTAGTVGLAPYERNPRAAEGAGLLGVPLIETVLAPCWHCGGATERHPDPHEPCWPPVRPSLQPCTCATPKNQSHRIDA